ncbi:MAG: CRISPR-associated endonuclease Cas1, partial [candidate division WOR-3 bacterium]|nr:CRISPR-associated endonuclease Cas1 [candidate division WOR-3 bacterium]
MRKSLYIFRSGKIYRKENTIYFENEKEKKSSPVNAILDIHIFGEVDLNKRFLEFATKNKICI